MVSYFIWYILIINDYDNSNLFGDSINERLLEYIRKGK